MGSKDSGSKSYKGKKPKKSHPWRTGFSLKPKLTKPDEDWYKYKYDGKESKK